MATPTLAREGVRFTCTDTAAAFTCRTDDQGANLSVDVATDKNFDNMAGSVTDGTLNAGNNYQATAYVSGLTAGVTYYWRIKADDGAANEVVGSEILYSGKFTTIASRPRPVRHLMLGCFNGYNIGQSATRAQEWATPLCQNLVRLNPDYCWYIGDVYYSDAGTTRGAATSEPATEGQAWTDDATSAYKENAWYAQDGSVPLTDDSTLARHRTNAITTIDGNCTLDPNGIGFKHLMAKYPGFYQLDDHETYNDSEDHDEGSPSAAKANKLDNGHQVAMEFMFDLMKPAIDADTDSSGTARDYDTDVRGDLRTPQMYYVVDVPPVRYIVLDSRNGRDANSDTDDGTIASPNKAMLNAEHLAWTKARIDDNPQPFVAIVSPVMFDGDHGYFEDSLDCWKGFSYQRENLFEHIWKYGDPHRTVLLSFDTHNGSVAKYRGPNKNRVPIWEFMASNGGWGSASHFFTTGWSSDIRHPSQAGGAIIDQSAVGYGGELQYMHTRDNNAIMVSSGPGYMRVQMIETNPDARSGQRGKPRILYTKEFR